MNFTQQQLDIINKDIGPGEVMKIIAGAGSGKTTTMNGYSSRRPKSSFLYLAFNKSVQQEAERKFSRNTEARTMHSLAYHATGLKYAQGGKSIASSVGFKPIRIHFKVRIKAAACIRATVQNFLSSADRKIEKKHVMVDNEMGTSFDDPVSFVLDKATELWEVMVSGSNKFLPMTHDGYLKLFQLQKPALTGDIILCDEAQDINPVVADIVMSQLERKKSVIFCGDKFQQIYGWRGALDAMENIDGETLYLSQSFRFGDNVSAYANALLDVYFEPDFTLEGLNKGDSVTASTHEYGQQGNESTAILFRTNSKAFEKMFELAENNVSFYFCGDLAVFLDFVLDVFYLKMGYVDKITPRSRVKSFDNYGEFVSVSEIDAELSSIRKIVETHKTKIPEVVDKIRWSQADFVNHADVTISTAHKSKGLEWDRVVLNDDFVPIMKDGKMLEIDVGAPSDVQDVIRDPEDINLIYVAMTRARKKLELPPGLLPLLKCYQDNSATGSYFYQARSQGLNRQSGGGFGFDDLKNEHEGDTEDGDSFDHFSRFG